MAKKIDHQLLAQEIANRNAGLGHLHDGDVLAMCSVCGASVEVREGWIAEAHLTPARRKVCAGSHRKPRRYEKAKYEAEAARFAWRSEDE